jgi:hypothetical protein
MALLVMKSNRPKKSSTGRPPEIRNWQGQLRAS